MAIDEKRIEKIESDIEKIKEIQSRQEITIIKNREDLKDIIREAVKEANNQLLEKWEKEKVDTITKIEQQEKRIIELENNDGKKALLIVKSVGATTLGYVVLGILNNLGLFFKK